MLTVEVVLTFVKMLYTKSPFRLHEDCKLRRFSNDIYPLTCIYSFTFLWQ